MLSDEQQARLLARIDMLADAPRLAETQAELVEFLAAKVQSRHLPAFLDRIARLAKYPGPGGLLAEYEAVVEAVPDQARDYSQPVCRGCSGTNWRVAANGGVERCDHREGFAQPAECQCDVCSGMGCVVNSTTLMFEACVCDGALGAEAIEKMNQKFGGGPKTFRARSRSMTNEEFAERAAL